MTNNIKPKILIVDDAPENIHILLEALGDNYNIFAAKDGDRALELVKDSSMNFDLILLDILMPKVDGYEVCRKLKQNLKTSNIPIIFIQPALHFLC